MRTLWLAGFALLTSISGAHCQPSPIPSPLVGHSYEQKLSEQRWWTMDVEPTRLVFTAMSGEQMGKVVLIVENPKVMEIGDQLYLFRWQEENKATAVHVIDLRNGVEHFSSTRPDLTFVALEGTVKQLK
jgi:hypothetical protein